MNELARSTAQRVERLANEVMTLIERAELPHLKERVKLEERRWLEADFAVVFAGESQKGKTSLINALIGRPDLLPVRAGSTTTYVTVHQGATDAARVTLLSNESIQIDPRSLRDWVTDEGNANNDREVARVDVAADSPLLRSGFVVMDTPGVGGLGSHSQLMMLIVEQADALILVTDSGAPLSTPEIAFLVDATARIEEPVIILNKIDQGPHWRDIARENDQLLSRHLPAARLPAQLPASAALALRTEGEPGLAEAFGASGIPQLRELLMGAIGARRHAVRLANFARTLLSALELIELTLPASTVEVDDEVLQRRSRAGLLMGDAFAALRSAATARYQEDLADIEQRFRARIGSWRAGQSVTLGDDLETELRRLSSSLAAHVSAESDAIRARLAESLRLTAVLQRSETAALKVEVRQHSPNGRAVRGSSASSPGDGAYETARSLVTPVLIGSGLAGAIAPLASLAGMAFVAPVLAPVLAGGALVMGLRARRRMREQRTALEGLAEVLRQFHIRLQPALHDYMLAAQRRLEEDVSDAISRERSQKLLGTGKRLSLRAEDKKGLSLLRDELGDVIDSLRRRGDAAQSTDAG